MTVTTRPVRGPADAVSLVPGESIAQTLTGVWTAHVAAHVERCGAVRGPLAGWVCRQGHPLYQ